MAAINTIAKEWANEIRDGIAWVIVWKTGRSWNAQAVWLNSDTDTFEPEDLDLAREILEKDPKAVMINGYYCGHFGEDMTVAELAAGIRWHYENGYNLLDGSTAFPPEPAERLTDRQQETDKPPTPGALYIDGQRFTGQIAELEIPHFSPPDLTLPELRSPPSMELTLTITPDTATAILNALQPAALRFFKALVNAAREAWARLKKAAKEAGRIMARIADKCMDAMLYKANDHPKWWHYYKHAKKYRVRKKYRRRLEQQLRSKLLAAATG
ncbi:MAG: hypothetical protein OSJ71_13860 [Acetatifactor sp.]|nr:hypothetical protein [Acetatifactor sp.]